MPEDSLTANAIMENARETYPGKFASEHTIFSHIHRGDRIFIGTGCGEPQYLINALINYVKSNPKAFFDAELIQVWNFGIAPFTEERFRANFRSNSFFVGNNIREAVNAGVADYTPIFLSQIPDLFYRGAVPINVAMIQTSLPDSHGYLSLGISVDITKAAIENAPLVIAQINSNMPRVHGDGFIHIEDVDFIVYHDEPLLEYAVTATDEIAQSIGKYVSRIIQDGDTIQVGYGSIPNAIMANLSNKKHLGVHTELLSDGIVELMKKRVIDNTRKSIDRGKTVASFCMGKKTTYDYIHDNPNIEFKTIDYTNNPLIVAQDSNIVAINSALEVDLTGQATAESIGKDFYSGIGGHTDFMRGAILATRGKTILTIQTTARDGEVSRIVPFLQEGEGVTLNRGDIHYVVTEYGIAYLHGKNIRERAMELIAIAHPKFRQWLIEEARKRNLIYRDQAFIPGKEGEYPEDMETFRTLKSALEIFVRPVKISDEPLLKEFFYSLSDNSLFTRFISLRKDMPHQRLQKFAVIDYSKDLILLALLQHDEKEVAIGIGECHIYEDIHTAEVAFAVRDDYHNQGIATELLNYLIYLGKRQGLLGFTADALAENHAMLHVFEKAGFRIVERSPDGMNTLKLDF